jgi:hypothetical protein
LFLLILIGLLAQERLRKAAGHEKLKDHQKPMLERRAIIARRLLQATRTAITFGPFILLPQGAAEWKKILRGYRNFSRSRSQTNALPEKHEGALGELVRQELSALLEGLHEGSDGFGVVGGHAAQGFLVRRFLGIIPGGQHCGDLIGGDAGAHQFGTNFALAFGAVAGGALGFEDGGAVLGESGQGQRQRHCDDEQQNERFGDSHNTSLEAIEMV